MARCGSLLLLLVAATSGYQLVSSQEKDGQVKKDILSNYDQKVPSLPYVGNVNRKIPTFHNGKVLHRTRRGTKTATAKEKDFVAKHVLVLETDDPKEAQRNINRAVAGIAQVYRKASGTEHTPPESTLLVFNTEVDKETFILHCSYVANGNKPQSKLLVTENKYLVLQSEKNGQGVFETTGYFRGKFTFNVQSHGTSGNVWKVTHGEKPTIDAGREVTTLEVELELREKQGYETYRNDLNKDLGDVICDTFSDDLEKAEDMMKSIVTEATRQANGDPNDPAVVELDNKFKAQRKNKGIQKKLEDIAKQQKEDHMPESVRSAACSSQKTGTTKCRKRKRDGGMIGRRTDDMAKRHMGLGKDGTADEDNNSLPADEAIPGDEDKAQPESIPGSEKQEDEDEDEDEVSEEIKEEDRK